MIKTCAHFFFLSHLLFLLSSRFVEERGEASYSLKSIVSLHRAVFPRPFILPRPSISLVIPIIGNLAKLPALHRRCARTMKSACVAIPVVTMLVLVSMGGFGGREDTSQYIPEEKEEREEKTAHSHSHSHEKLQGERCRGVAPGRKTNLNHTEVIVEGEGTLTAGTMVTMYLIARDTSDNPTCTSGDMFEAIVWSETNRVPASIYDEGNGLYKLTWTPALPGVFEVRLHLFFTGWMGFKGWPNETAAHQPYLKTTLNAYHETLVAKLRTQPSNEWCHDPNSEFKYLSKNIKVGGTAVLPKQVCQQTWNTGLKGSWVRSPNGTCYPGICKGDLSYAASDGWVYVPKDCYLRLYNRESAWDCLNGKRLMWFGDSTLKQPATNLLENLLGVSVIKRSFNWIKRSCPIGKILKSKRVQKQWKANHQWGCHSPFDHRQWKVKRSNPKNEKQTISFRYVWGGGPTPMARPNVSPRAMALLKQPKQKTRTTRDVYAEGLTEGVDYLFLHAFIWDEEAGRDFAAFEQTVHGILREALNANNKIEVHWDTGHPLCVSDMFWNPQELCVSSVVNKLQHITAHQNAVLIVKSLAKLAGANPRVTVTDRFSMAEPHVIGPNYCHFGIHFGAHDAFCHLWNPPDPPACTRNWLVDKFELMMWMNKMCPADEPLPVSHEGPNMESGVLSEPPEGSETEHAF
eukprot:TRINITY_DN1508_c0_g1_i2.p1 TRINITY_DN1508_c0_g1~~TRINITY_DN1508_c0_g1_i2.p1  ORF type:complete len:687 (+),score=103.23 TRINITY_DN1508_c0_g1_i2:1015-3075(+)